MRTGTRHWTALSISILAIVLNITAIALIMACVLTQTRPGIDDGPGTCGPPGLYAGPWAGLGVFAGPVLHTVSIVFDEPGVAGFAILATIGVGFLLGLSSGWLWFLIAGILAAAWLIRWLNNLPEDWKVA